MTAHVENVEIISSEPNTEKKDDRITISAKGIQKEENCFNFENPVKIQTQFLKVRFSVWMRAQYEQNIQMIQNSTMLVQLKLNGITQIKKIWNLPVINQKVNLIAKYDKIENNLQIMNEPLPDQTSKIEFQKVKIYLPLQTKESIKISPEKSNDFEWTETNF